MKIACISASQVPSMTANSLQVMKACHGLSQLGHEVHLFVPGGRRPDGNIELTSFYGLDADFKIEWLPSSTSLRRYDLAFQAARRARRIKADACYVWFLQAGVFSLLAGLPVLIEMHGPPEGRFGPSLFRLFQRLPGKKRLLPITRALAAQLEGRFRLDASDHQVVVVSPNGVELERYADLPDPPAAREQLGLPPTLTVGYTGHLYPGRGMALLLDLARCFPSIHFLWVGGRPPEVSEWRARLAGEKIANITLTGYVQNSRMPLYQAASDILLMPYEKVITGSSGGDSTTYASPMKMFEYMASRRPIISSDLPVIREVLHPANAMLCPPDDIDAWSQALGSLITDGELRCSLAEQAWSDIQPHSWVERARTALEGFPPGT